eukprot:581190-Lingulodinium_polyedra.AAC.1
MAQGTRTKEVDNGPIARAHYTVLPRGHGHAVGSEDNGEHSAGAWRSDKRRKTVEDQGVAPAQ